MFASTSDDNSIAEHTGAARGVQVGIRMTVAWAGANTAQWLTGLNISEYYPSGDGVNGT